MRISRVKPIKHEPMKCKFCDAKLKLIPVKLLLKRQISSLDFDEDGKTFKICPNCFSLDNMYLREARYLNQALQDNQYLFSRDDKKKVLHYLVGKQKLEHSEKRLKIKHLMDEIKHKGDNNVLEYLSKHFSIPKIKVDMLFYNVKIYWILMKENS